MAFENVNTSSLKYALNSCKNSINRSISENLSNSIINNNIWYCDSRNKLKRAIDRNMEIYDRLESQIDEYLQVANKIEEYKNLEEENRNLRNEYRSLEGRLWEEEDRTHWYYNWELQKWDYDDYTVTVKNIHVENSMNRIQSEINSNTNRMYSLENSIKNMV